MPTLAERVAELESQVTTNTNRITKMIEFISKVKTRLKHAVKQLNWLASENQFPDGTSEDSDGQTVPDTGLGDQQNPDELD